VNNRKNNTGQCCMYIVFACCSLGPGEQRERSITMRLQPVKWILVAWGYSDTVRARRNITWGSAGSTYTGHQSWVLKYISWFALARDHLYDLPICRVRTKLLIRLSMVYGFEFWLHVVGDVGHRKGHNGHKAR